MPPKKPPPNELKLTGDLKQNWIEFEEAFEKYCVYIQKWTMNNTVLNDRNKIDMFLNIVGEDCISKLRALNLQLEDYHTWNSVRVILKTFCSGNMGLFRKQQRFFAHHQRNTLTFDDFYQSTVNLCEPCKFGDLEEYLFYYQIVYGLSDATKCERILRMNMKMKDIMNWNRRAERKIRQLQRQKRKHKKAAKQEVPVQFNIDDTDCDPDCDKYCGECDMPFLNGSTKCAICVNQCYYCGANDHNQNNCKLKMKNAWS